MTHSLDVILLAQVILSVSLLAIGVLIVLARRLLRRIAQARLIAPVASPQG
jgi:hypothetical protein